MSLVVHLSDLHFGDDARWQPDILTGLVHSLASVQERPGLLVLSGDVFDTCAPGPGVIDAFLALLSKMDQALGGDVPTLLVPGNHDRRHDGVFAPWSNALFAELATRLAPRPNVRVVGQTAPFLAAVVPLPGFPADVVAYDSTWLPKGLLSAGGVVRREDLVRVAGQLPPPDGSRPLVFVLHHHLVPTPITDTSLIDTRGRPVYQKLLVEELLPHLVANGDCEEITMTALGAGTALSALAQLGRPVLVLHGHKHYPVARLLKGASPTEADVLIASAGSCGTATPIMDAVLDDAPHLWPSFNLVRLTEGGLAADTVAWSPWEQGRRNPPRPLVHARRAGLRWDLVHDVLAPPPFEPVMAENVSEVTLTRSGARVDRFDVAVKRRLRGLPAARVPEYFELVDGPRGARLFDVRIQGVAQPEGDVPRRLAMPLTSESSWTVLGGAVASVREADATWGPGGAYDWVGLLNRSRCAKVVLRVNVSPLSTEPFAAAMDLTTGTERPVPFRLEGGVVHVELADCPARTLVRVLWPLEVS